ncbi:predicted protein [Naegleria gruberi]|uniref:Predicted protein n=1 Tax=Naegleria gruberi TaxID=5762 RepID=D2V7E5_NAEGR|nr:uncharacterized protein NAEGRDRAFT_64768 [Naegleria gruberi]EFC47361.1 predicted protein [Naegleria gruberi]|eukprot:XP_002680105.1 predicted protein [Naegleria gruberi strain NEG-M]
MKKQIISLLSRNNNITLLSGATTSSVSCCFSSTRSMNGRPKKNPADITTVPTINNEQQLKKSKTSITSEDGNTVVVDRTISLEKQNEILIQSMDKLSKKYEKMEKALAAQQELLGMMSTTLHVIGEQQVQNRVLQLLRLYKIIPAQNSANAPSPFIRVNTKDKLESLVTSFVNPQHLPTAIQSVKK